MPITQSRMLTLIEAAEDHAQARAMLIGLAATIAGRDPGRLSPEFNDLYAAIFACAPTTQSVVTIAQERKHYDLTSKRNARKAQRQREHREGFAKVERLVRHISAREEAETEAALIVEEMQEGLDEADTLLTEVFDEEGATF